MQLKHILALAVLLYGIPVDAAVRRCERCSPSSMQQSALSLPIGEHNIYSLSTNTMLAFSVTQSGVQPRSVVEIASDQSENLTAVTKRADPIDVNPDLAIQFKDAVDFFVETAGTMKLVDDVNASELGLSPGDGRSVTDFAMDWAMRRRVADAVSRHGSSIWSQFTSGVNSFFSQSDATIEITLHFSDGSTAKFRIRQNSATAEYSEDDYSAPDGQPVIPRNASSYGGSSYRFNRDRDLNWMLEHWMRMGIPVVYGGSSVTYSCTWDGVTLRCKPR